jgi:hypothetical protein
MAAPGFGSDMFSNLKTELSGQLPAYLKGQRWFGAKARELRGTEVVDFITLERDALHALVVMVKVEYEGGGADLYSVPLVVSKDVGAKGEPGAPGKKPAVLTVSGRNGGEAATLSDALKNETFLSLLLDAIGRRCKSGSGDVWFPYGEGPLSAHPAVAWSTGISRSARAAHYAGNSAGVCTESGRRVAIHDEVHFSFL